MVHGWYQNPFPTHMPKCPQSDERDHTACSSATVRGGQLPEGASGHQRIARPLRRQTSSKPPLPLLAVWDFARSPFGPQSTSRASENAAQSLWKPNWRDGRRRESAFIAMRKEVMGMMKPMTKKILLGAPAVALSAALACTMVACGGGGGEQGESGGDAAASKSAYESQKIEVEGFTVESLADGTYYRGEFYEQDGFWLRVRITNTSDKPLDRFSFTTNAAPGNLEPGDSIFNTFTAYVEEIETPPAELCKDAQTEGNPTIAPGESIEWVYFWVVDNNYYGPITVEFENDVSGGTNPSVMHFDTTGCETDEYKAVKEKADEIKALGGVDFETYSAKAADGWTLTEMDEKHSDAEFGLDAVDDGHVDVYTASKDPMGEAKLAQNNMGGGEIDEVEINGVTWTRFVATHGATYLYAEASNGTTVSIYANSNLTWEDALPMFEMVTLK